MKIKIIMELEQANFICDLLTRYKDGYAISECYKHDLEAIISNFIEVINESQEKIQQDVLEELEYKCEEIQKKTTTYVYLGSKDRHLIRILHWIEILKDLSGEVIECGQDKETRAELGRIIDRLILEVGVRMTSVFP